MKFDLEKKDELNAVLHLHIEKEDYSERVEKAIRDLRKSMNMPGFRKGHVPVGLIRKQYGQSILIDEINKILQDGVNGYIQEQQLTLLGQPLPIEDQSIDWEAESFDFSFEFGIAPSVQLTIDPQVDKLPYKKVNITEELVNEEVDALQRRHGQIDQVEEVGPADYVRGQYVEEGVDHGHSHSTGFRLDDADFSQLRELFVGALKEETRVIDVEAHFASLDDAARALGIESSHLQEHGKRFVFTIEGIVRVTPAAVDADLFEKVFPAVTEEAEFREKVKAQIATSFESDSQRMFENSMVDYLLDKLDIQLPEQFLKKWMTTAAEEPISLEQAEEEFPAMAKGIRWQLIENAVSQQEGLKVERTDMEEEARLMVREQMAAYGQSMIDDQLIESLSQHYLNDTNHVQKLYERARQRKVLAILAEKFGKNEELVDAKDFYTQQ
jgi:trigger factor